MTSEELLAAMLVESKKQSLLLEEIRKAVVVLGNQSVPSVEEMKKRVEGMFAGTSLETILRTMGGRANG